MKQQYCKYWEQIMSAAQLKAQVKGGCHCCAYVLGGDPAHLECIAGMTISNIQSRSAR
jgi:hypothetical protein